MLLVVLLLMDLLLMDLLLVHVLLVHVLLVILLLVDLFLLLLVLLLLDLLLVDPLQRPATCSEVWSVAGPGAPAGPAAGDQGSLPPSRLRLSMLLLLMHRGKLGAGLEI